MFLFLLALPSLSLVVVAATTVTKRMAVTIILHLEVSVEMAQVAHVKVMAHPVIILHKPLLSTLLLHIICI